MTGRGRRGGRAAEGPALEKRYPAKSGIVGSNPTLSAKAVCFADYKDKIQKSATPRKSGEMTELAEGARLEIVCAV